LYKIIDNALIIVISYIVIKNIVKTFNKKIKIKKKHTPEISSHWSSYHKGILLLLLLYY